MTKEQKVHSLFLYIQIKVKENFPSRQLHKTLQEHLLIILKQDIESHHDTQRGYKNTFSFILGFYGNCNTFDKKGCKRRICYSCSKGYCIYRKDYDKLQKQHDYYRLCCRD